MGFRQGKRVLATCVATLTALSMVGFSPATAEPQKPGTEGSVSAQEARVNVLVMLDNQPASPSTSGEARNLRTQIQQINSWSAKYGLKVDRQFGFLLNGFSASIPASQIPLLKAEKGVSNVQLERQYSRTEYEARESLQVPQAFEEYGVDGENTVIAIIDSGVDAEHKDMRLDDGVEKKLAVDKSSNKFTEKVPFGYNYADENYEFWDTTESQHGMHVAGIAAANAVDGDPNGIDGAAPNAQILSMKVFSNGASPYASDSDIIAAIEDSVKRGADVLNLSLGSPNGIEFTSDGAYRALAKAEEMGVLTVIAAANEGQNFSPTGEANDAIGLWDDGTVGTPAVQGPALTVASVDNAVVSNPAGFFNDGEDHRFGYSLQTGEIGDTPVSIVDMGLGKTENYPVGTDLTGKWALIERGEISFAEKFQRAIEHGASGVLVFNSAAGTEEYVGMAGLEGITIVGASIRREDGLAMREALAAGTDVTVRLTSSVISEPNPTAAEASSFTSWGSTPDLQIEPDIAGIGGSVYSTLNNDTYGTKSGTSMAAPNVAGLSALIIQEYRERYPDLSATEQIARARIALMNTAIPVTGGGKVAPVRQVGAGLAQVDNALDAHVFATVDSEASVALGQVNEARSFTVTLTNTSDKAVTYTAPPQVVYNETNAAGEATETVVSNETLSASASSVTVPAHGTAKVTFTLIPDTSKGDHFVEGYAVLESASAPSLSIPYLGFVGDWNREPIIAAPGTGWDVIGAKSEVTHLSTFLDFAGSPFPMRFDADDWFSPNGDGSHDVITPELALMRNASDIEYAIYTKDGTLVRELGEGQSVPRAMAKTVEQVKQGLIPEGSTLTTGAAFDGSIYDPASDEFTTIGEGEYVYRVRTRLSEDYEWQSVEMPFSVDLTAPTVEVSPLEGNTVRVKVSDSLSGPSSHLAPIDATGEALPVESHGNGEFTVTVANPEKSKYLWFTVADQAFNKVDYRLMLNQDHLEVLNNSLFTNPRFVLGNAYESLVDGKFQLQGVVSSQAASVEINGEKVEISNGGFTELMDLVPDDYNTFEIRAFDAAGNELEKETLKFFYDSQLPEVDTSGSNLDEDGRLAIAADGTVTIRGTVKDPAPSNPSAQAGGMWGAIGETYVPINPDGSFEATVTPTQGDSYVTLLISDGANYNFVVLELEGMFPGSLTTPTPTFGNLECLVGFSLCLVPAGSADLNDAGDQFTLRGEGGQPGSIVTITPGLRDGGAQSPIEVTVGEDGTFEIQVPLAVGENHFGYTVKNADGVVKDSTILNIWFDVSLPSVRFEEPNLIGGTLFTNKDEVTFSGTAEDDGWGYALRVNNQTAAEIFISNAIGAESNRRDFSEVVAVKDGDTILVTFADSVGNTRVAAIPVVVDKDKPTLGIDGVIDAERITDQRSITASASDENLASFSAHLQGTTAKGELSRVLAEEAVELTSSQVRVEDTLVDLNELGIEGSASESATGEDPAADPASGEAPGEITVDATGTKAASSTTELTTTLDTSTLDAGRYTMIVGARDLAENSDTLARSFIVDADPVITAKDLSYTVKVDELKDQDALLETILSEFSVSDDGAVLADGTVKGGEETTLSLAKDTSLTEGENTVHVIATDATGRQVVKTVTVTIDVERPKPQDPPQGDQTPTPPVNGENPGDTEDKPGPGQGNDHGGDNDDQGSKGTDENGSSQGKGANAPGDKGHGKNSASKGSSLLPRTGTEFAAFALTGIALAGAGAVLLAARRRSLM